ncbi:hypothetical protein, partial [Corynebacterium pseudodiphtheriticum]|uniref:hypothetical protein n=1 Tax=Corynebacterium pseudodiphtheriticum TaxID=37637 RepID=UPI001EE81550
MAKRRGDGLGSAYVWHPDRAIYAAEVAEHVLCRIERSGEGERLQGRGRSTRGLRDNAQDRADCGFTFGSAAGDEELLVGLDQSDGVGTDVVADL